MCQAHPKCNLARYGTTDALITRKKKHKKKDYHFFKYVFLSFIQWSSVKED